MSQMVNQVATAPLFKLESEPVVQFVTGRQQVLRLSDKLIEFSARCDQPGAMHDIAYFLSKPGALPRIPHLLLVSNGPELNLKSPNLDDLIGVLLIFEQSVAGRGLGAFATNDRSGRNTLVARAPDREWVAALASRALLSRGAHLILMSFSAAERLGPTAAVEPPMLEVAGHGKSVARWARRDRTIPGYLPLSMSFDATLAKIGQRTRSNLRYYRRRAERELGCVFLPQVEISREEMLIFNNECMFAVPAEVAGWRYGALKELSDPILMGIQDREGRWLSILGGRRYLDRSELLWQLNREGLAANSLSTVMRSYFIEHEIAHGSRRFYIEGGTEHPIGLSFVPESLTDLVVVRRTLAAKAMRMIAVRYISGSNELAHLLGATDLNWLPC
jgi:hypothetical protein